MEAPEKIVDTRNYVRILEELTKEEKSVGIPVAGNSMAPFLISGRDHVLFQKPDRPLRVGDIVFFQRENGEYVLHRIRKIRNGMYYIVGDAQTVVEGPIREKQIFGLVTKVRRKGKWIDESDSWWLFFEKIWIHMIPFRPLVRGLYNGYFRLFVTPTRNRRNPVA